MRISELTAIIDTAAAQKREKGTDFPKYQSELNDLSKRLGVLLVTYSNIETDHIETDHEDSRAPLQPKASGLFGKWTLASFKKEIVHTLDLNQHAAIINAVKRECFKLAMELAAQYATQDCANAVLHPNTHHRVLVKHAIEASATLNLPPVVGLGEDDSEHKSDDAKIPLSTKAAPGNLEELLEKLTEAKRSAEAQKMGSINSTGSFQQLINLVSALVKIETEIGTKLSSTTHNTTNDHAYFPV